MWQHYLMDDHLDKAPLQTADGQKSTSRLNDISPKSTERFVENSELTVHEAVKFMWTSNLPVAEDWFQRNLEQDPRCAIHYAEAGFLKAVILGDNQSKEAVIERLDNAEMIAEKFVKKWETEGNKVLETKGTMLSPNEAMKIIKAAQNLRLALVVKAEATLFKSGNQILKNKLSLGSMNFRRAWKIYQKANKIAEAQKWVEKQYFSPEEIKGLQTQIEGDINNFIQFGEGVICLGLSMAPKTMSKLANIIIGLDGDQSRGLKILYDCINSKKGVRVPLALMFVLFWLLIYIPEFIPGKHERYREAHDLIRFALHYLPQSPYFYWLESYMNQRQGNLERALKLLNRVIAYSGRTGIDENPGRLSFERGWVLFLCQDWESARQCFEISIEKASDTPFTHLLLGVSYCMLNELQLAEDTLESIASYNKESSSVEEKWIHKRASSYLGRRWFQLFPFEISYVTDYLQGLKYDWLESSYDYLTSIDIEDSEEKDEIVISMLLQGAILRHLGRLREAVLILEAGIKLEQDVKKEIWVVPHIYYELGIVYVKSRDWTTSSAYIRKAKSFKRSYEFKASLSFKLNATLELILQEENKEFKK
ncbi:unnamed protein product [Blepharisma stoltei]|uniref:Tetratricopeptide repeat protein n=1 Tax=Blepharisma stoltei TaxID=1481888 RepID=A0AAU9I3G8_9CILI|nr:unnamed protein product [Blepharisma stoltei]